MTWLLPDALQRPFFLFFVAAAGLSAWYGGWLPGLISVALGTLATAYFFLAPGRSLVVLGPMDQVRLGLFTVSAIFIVWLFAMLRSTQLALQGNADRFRRAQRSANIAAYDWELASGRLHWSEELPILKGLVSDGQVASWMALVAPEDRKRLEVAVDRAIGSGEEIDTDFRIVLPQGGTHWLAARGQASYQGGNPARILGVVADIHDRRTAETRLEAQHAITRALVESPHPAAAIPKVLRIIGEAQEWPLGQLWRLDRARGVLRASVAWRREPRLAQFERDTRAATFARGAGLPGRVWETGQPAWSTELSRDADPARQALFARDGLCSAFAFPIQLDSQVLGVMEFLSQDARPEDAELLQTVADIGAQIGQFIERRRIQDALRESEERYRTTLGSIGDAVIATDAEGRVQFLNAVAQELTGCSQQDCDQRPISEVFRIRRDNGSEPGTRDPVRRVLETSAPASLKEGAVLLAHDGREIPIDDSAAPIRNDAGELIGVVLVFRDLRGRRRAEEALRSSEKLAATGRLAASIAHEINNPMEAVGNLLYLIEHHAGLDDTAREYTRLAEQELGRMDKIVKQTLGFYRESAEPVPVRLVGVLDNVLELYARRIQKARVQVHKRYRFDGEVKAFPGEMRQVFSNLVANALDAVGEGGAIGLHVTRSYDWSGPRRPGVRVTIADNGSGISRENLHRIFEPFFTTKGVNGTGLGLWVTYGIVRKHGGRIHVRSSNGARSGTCFSVFLPDSMAAGGDSSGTAADSAPLSKAA